MNIINTHKTCIITIIYINYNYLNILLDRKFFTSLQYIYFILFKVLFKVQGLNLYKTWSGFLPIKIDDQKKSLGNIDPHEHISNLLIIKINELWLFIDEWCK